MSTQPLPYRAPIDDYQQEAATLFAALSAGDDAAQWRFKWEHPRFRGKHVNEVRAATLELADAQTVVAREYGFEDWADLGEFARAVTTDERMARFEAAVEAVVAGDVTALRKMLRDDPELVRARSTRRHHATLLHYVAANGVEGGRQQTPENAVEVAKVLLEAGAEADALADMYDAKCTTMSMLVSSTHPARRGVQAELAETLLDYGAAFEGPGSEWQSAVLTALTFGFRDTAETLVRHGAPLTSLAAAAGLGRVDEAARLLPDADTDDRQIALALAAQHGQVEVVRLLLDAGEDPSRYNPERFHSHSTPLHQAIWSDHADVVRLLVERGASLELRDRIYDATPLGWAEYGGRTAIADYLRERDAP